jgi:hypothetical protein
MDGKLRFLWLPAVVLLFLCTLPSRVDAQHFVCRPIAPGDTATSLARRLTGSAAGAYDHAFQIRDPVRQMFVPKSHYQRLESDWQACVASAPVFDTPVAYAPVVELAASTIVSDSPQPPALIPAPLANHTHWRLPSASFTATAGAALVVVGLFSVVLAIGPRPMPPSVRRAGEKFIGAFAEPLVDASSEVSPIQTRLRFVRRTQQLEISLAPGPGRRYPNLADHKHNVEYDVDRVVRALGNFVLTSPPRADGKWVVVAIRPKVRE